MDGDKNFKSLAVLTGLDFNLIMAAHIVFSENLRVLFKKSQEKLSFPINSDHNSVKHWIEFHGVPHTEVGSIHANKILVDFNYRPQRHDQIQIEALLGPVDVTQATFLRPTPYPAHRFIVDECVKNLATKLRMIGCDVFAESGCQDKEIVDISVVEQRVILTRDRGLLKRKGAVWGRLIRSTDSDLQLREVIQFYALSMLPQALTKCLVCNGEIHSVSKNEILDRLEPKTRLYYSDFSRCNQCGKIYWEGTHYNKMQKSLKNMFPESAINLRNKLSVSK